MTKKNTPMLRRARRAGVLGAAAALLAAGAAVSAAPAQAATASANTWDKLAACESGGNWSINTGNGYSGGLQFTSSTWKAYGGKGSAHNASKAEQIRVAKKVQAGQGWGAWPACSAKLGLSGSKGASDGATGSGSNTSGKKSVASTSARTSAPSTSTRSYSAKATTKSYAGTSKSYAGTAAKAAPAAPALALPKNVKDSGKDYTIKSGDTLATIAKAQGFDSWLSLYALNKSTVANPDLIFVGQKLSLPTA
ncbi:transglycosylase family protein [Galactobacter valiniphilus]|uniref:transglycosylase family protein n=1 Tax=Galactobacter valiniphilus TaxID=2676122 RepID=UPI0037364333